MADKEKMQIDASWLQGRTHPDYYALVDHWRFVEQSYKGGRAWFDGNIHKYGREGPEEYFDRVKRAYRFNHTREVVDLMTKYIFKSDIHRKEDAPQELQDFWKRATRRGQGIDTLTRELSRATSLYGQPAIVVDNTAKPREDGGPVSISDQKNSDARVYSYLINPQDILNMSFDEHGELNWILYKESKRSDEEFFSDFESYTAFRLWTRDESFLFKLVEMTEEEIRKEAADAISASAKAGTPLPTFKPSADVGGVKDEKQLKVEVESRVPHNLGKVPVVLVSDRDSDSPYSAPALVDDIAYLDRAVANYLSNLDGIIQDQTFSVLTIPAQSLTVGGGDDAEAYEKIVKLGTDRIFAYDAEGGKGPEFISPNPSQAQIILAVITKIITEIYHSIGMAGERTKMDNAAGIDNSSGVAKAYDFDRMNTMLNAKADRLEWAENEVAKIVMLWHSQTLTEDQVKYPEEFDTRNLYDEFDVANRLTLLDTPKTMRRHQLERLVDKLFPNLKKDLREKILKEASEWPSDEVDLTRSPSTMKDRTVPVPDKRQGQNNKDDDQ